MKWESPVIITARTVALFIGKRGTGKSTRRKGTLALAQEAGQRRIISFDVLDEDSVHGRQRDSVVLGPLKQRMTTRELEENPDVLLSDELSLAIVPVSRDPREWAADFSALVEDLEADDEARGTILSASELAVWSKYCADVMDRVACLSRHWGMEGCAFLADSQRATGITFTTRTQATDILSGLQDMEEDVDALRGRCGVRYGDEVAACKGYEFRHWRDTDGPWTYPPGHKKPGAARKEKRK